MGGIKLNFVIKQPTTNTAKLNPHENLSSYQCYGSYLSQSIEMLTAIKHINHSLFLHFLYVT